MKRELKYRIVRKPGAGYDGKDIFESQVKYKWWLWWVMIERSMDEQLIRTSIARHRKRRTSKEVVYNGNGKDLHFMEEL